MQCSGTNEGGRENTIPSFPEIHICTVQYVLKFVGIVISEILCWYGTCTKFASVLTVRVNVSLTQDTYDSGGLKHSTPEMELMALAFSAAYATALRGTRSGNIRDVVLYEDLISDPAGENLLGERKNAMYPTIFWRFFGARPMPNPMGSRSV